MYVCMYAIYNNQLFFLFFFTKGCRRVSARMAINEQALKKQKKNVSSTSCVCLSDDVVL